MERGDRQIGGGTNAPRRRRLHVRIARHIMFAVVVSLAGSSLVLVSLRQRSLVHSLETSARTYAALVSPQLVRSAEVFRSSGRNILRQRVNALLELDRDVVRLEVFDVEGRLVMRVEGTEVTTFADPATAPRVSDAKLLAAIQGLDVVAERLAVGETSSYRVVAPAVEERGRHAYSLVATFGYASVASQLNASIGWSGLHLLGGLLLALLVAAVLARPITASVERLREGVRTMQEGHLEERVRIDSGDEIQELAEAFNAMADALLATIGELREANRELESLDQAKADLVANFSHELKTPLTALRGYVELLAEGTLGPLSPEADRAVEVCRNNVQRLTGRIEELVQLSQLEQRPQPELPSEPLAIGQLLHATVETLLPRIEERHITCSLNLATDVGSVSGSQEHLERVFLNLVDNAVKFTANGGTIRISAEPHRHDGRPGVLVRVADTGIGIPPAEQRRIFDRFYQVDSSAHRRHGGMGLGLSLVRSIVEAHRGVVWVESAHGQGSTFLVWLP